MPHASSVYCNIIRSFRLSGKPGPHDGVRSSVEGPPKRKSLETLSHSCISCSSLFWRCRFMHILFCEIHGINRQDAFRALHTGDPATRQKFSLATPPELHHHYRHADEISHYCASTSSRAAPAPCSLRKLQISAALAHQRSCSTLDFGIGQLWK